ncbi:MAG: BatA domain-containing protein [Thalassotalea sp.]
MNNIVIPQVFMQPWAWLGLAALAIPVIIHLLSKSKGRLVQWGTTQFLPQSKPIKMTQIRLTQRLLLVLRCLIILFSVAIVAQLIFTPDSEDNDTVVLVNQQWFVNAKQSERDKVAAYLNLAKHKVVWLDTFEAVSTDRHKNEIGADKTLNIWRQLSLANEKFTNAKQFLVFTRANTQQFIGEKALITQKIEWFIEPATTQASKQKKLNTIIEQPFNAAIYADNGHREALAYLIPALNVIKQLNIPQLNVEVFEQHQALESAMQPTWLFYLSDQEVPAFVTRWQQQGTHLVTDGSTVSQTIPHTPSELTSGYGLVDEVMLYKLNSVDADKKIKKETDVNNKVLWRTKRNTPVLTVSHKNETVGKHYHFNGLFSKKWTNLVTQAQFPLVIQTLLFGDKIAQHQRAINQVSTENIKQLSRVLFQQALAHNAFVNHLSTEKNAASAQIANITTANSQQAFNSQQVQLWLGCILVMLFLIERMLSEFTLRQPLVVNNND